MSAKEFLSVVSSLFRGDPYVTGTRGSRWALLACVVMVAAAAMAAGPVGAAGRTVRVGVYQNKPKIFVDENEQASGIFVDLLDEIGAEEGWTLVYVPCQWADCLAALEEGRIDLMPDVAHSAERAQIYDFHLTPVLESWSQVYTSPGVKINGYSDLAGAHVAILQGSIQQTVFEQYMLGFGFDVTIVRQSRWRTRSAWQGTAPWMQPSPTTSSGIIITRNMGW